MTDIERAAIEKADYEATGAALLARITTTPAAAQAERGEGLCYPFSTETCKRPGCTCRDEARAATNAARGGSR